MKPMPASCTQRPTWSGVRSILTPSEASTSAAPERDDSARLPCLATGTPAPATMKDAQVETLTEPEPSPPVPTMSTASGGAWTVSVFELLHHLGRLGLQLGRDLVLPPARLDLIADLIQIAVARGRDGEHVVPD